MYKINVHSVGEPFDRTRLWYNLWVYHTIITVTDENCNDIENIRVDGKAGHSKRCDHMIGQIKGKYPNHRLNVVVD